MPTDSTEQTYCNARLKGNGDTLPKTDPGPHAGDGYCEHPTRGGRCRMHSGKGGGRPTSHGLYSFKREDLEERFREAYRGEDWADMRAEIAAVRTLLSDYLEDLSAVDSDTISDTTKLLGELRRLTSDLQEMLHRERLTREEEQRLFDTFTTIIRNHVPEGEQDAALGKLDAASASGGDGALPSGGR